MVFRASLSIYLMFPGSLWINSFFREIIIFSRIYHVFILFIANSLRIHLVFGEFFMNLSSSSWNNYEFTTDFANSLCIHFRFREFAVYFVKISWIHCLFRDSTINSLSVSRIININPLSFLPIHHEFTIFSANSLWISLFYAN